MEKERSWYHCEILTKDNGNIRTSCDRTLLGVIPFRHKCGGCHHAKSYAKDEIRLLPTKYFYAWSTPYFGDTLVVAARDVKCIEGHRLQISKGEITRRKGHHQYYNYEIEDVLTSEESTNTYK